MRPPMADMLMTSAEVWNISPIPTNGETIPPIPNPTAPNIADAAPIAFLPASIAMVLVEVKINPKQSIRRKVHPSYMSNICNVCVLNSCRILNNVIPHTPTLVAELRLGIRIASIDPIPMPIAFTPKNRANANSEKENLFWIMNEAEAI